jgi:pentatricopeptide repeat protein
MFMLMIISFYKTVGTCYNNMAACHIKNGNWEKAVKACDKVLEKQPNNAKALFRRGQSNLALKNLDKAETDLRKAIQIEPNDVGIRNELAKIKKIRDEYDAKQKREFAGMFDKH